MSNRFSKSLIVVESPTKCKTIAGYLKSMDSIYSVVATYGHVRNLPRKNGSVLPEQDFKMIWEESPGSAKHIQEIISRAKEIDNAEGVIILATDADREGEAISWHISEILRSHGVKCEIKRIIFQEITKKSILHAISDPLDLNIKKVHSYFARLGLDYLVGFGISPILWTKVKGCRSAGRVQSAALRAIIDRELEIIRFKPEKYWTLSAQFKIEDREYNADLIEWRGEQLEKFMWNEQSVSEAREVLLKDEYNVEKVETKKHSRAANPPLITSTMQQEASRRFGWRPSRTLKVAQKLYEGVKVHGATIGLITYMRTDSLRISEEALKDCHKTVKSLYGENYLKARQYQNKGGHSQDAHEAIRPTQFSNNPDAIAGFLDEDMIKLYDLIWRRAVASQMSDAEYLITNVMIAGQNGKWKVHGRERKFDGFLKVMADEQEEENQKIQNISHDAVPSCNDVTANEHLTQAQGRFTEAGLIKHLDDVGIGRPSTYASILETLENREYIERQNKKLVPLVKGWFVTGFLTESCPDYIRDDFTAKVEDDLDRISRGEAEWKGVMGNFWGEFSKVLSEMSKLDPKSIVTKISDRYSDYFFGIGGDAKSCPKCHDGHKVLCLMRDGEFVGCSNHPVCDWRQGLNQKEFTVIGIDPDSNEEILLKHGPYGRYLHWANSKRNVPLPEKIAATINLETAVKLGKLPRVIGQHPYTGKEIKVNIGRYGPYIFYNSVYVSCKVENVYDMTLEKAVELLGASKKLKDKSLAND